jgi:hypothetical protein
VLSRAAFAAHERFWLLLVIDLRGADDPDTAGDAGSGDDRGCLERHAAREEPSPRRSRRRGRR